MKINLNKTKVKKLSKSNIGQLNIRIRGIQLEQVDRFRYFDSDNLGRWEKIGDDQGTILQQKTTTERLDWTIKKRIKASV